MRVKEEFYAKLQSEQLQVRSRWREIGIDRKILLKRGLELIDLMVAR